MKLEILVVLELQKKCWWKLCTWFLFECRETRRIEVSRVFCRNLPDEKYTYKVCIVWHHQVSHISLTKIRTQASNQSNEGTELKFTTGS